MNWSKKDVVLFLPGWYPNKTSPFPGDFIQTHAKALNEVLTVHVLHVLGITNTSKLFSFEKENDEVETYMLYYRRFKTKNWATVLIEGALYGIASFIAYYKYRKLHQKPSFLHVHVLTRAGVLAWLIAVFSSYKYVITEHWSRYFKEDNTYHGFFRRFLTKRIIAKSEGISTVSNALKNAMITHGLKHQQFHLVSNIVREEFTSLEPHFDFKPNHFLHVSSFDEKSKNVKGILRAFQIVQKEIPDVHLKLVGGGNKVNEVKKYAEQLDLQNVEFTGDLTGQELAKAHLGNSALILFSNFENQPSVILEAHTLGLPVIGSNVAGIPELINSENGVLVEVANEADLAEKIKSFASGTYHFDREAIRETALSKYTKTSVVKQILNFYECCGLKPVQ